MMGALLGPMGEYFTARGPLVKKQNLRDFEMLEFMVTHPLPDFSPEEKLQMENMGEPESTELI